MHPLSFIKAHFRAKTLSAYVVAGAFLWSGVHDLKDLSSFAESIAAYEIIEGSAVAIAALLVPSLSIVAGLALLVPRVRNGASMIVTGMLFAFMLAMSWAKFRGLNIDCGCSIAGGSIQESYPFLMGRNILLIAASAFAGSWGGQMKDVVTKSVSQAVWILVAAGTSMLAIAVLHPEPPSVSAGRKSFSVTPVASSSTTTLTKAVPGVVRELTMTEAKALGPEAVWIDVRPRALYAQAHIEGAVNIPVNVLKGHLPRLKEDGRMATPFVLYCPPRCGASHAAAEILSQNGFTDVSLIKGGWAPQTATR